MDGASRTRMSIGKKYNARSRVRKKWGCKRKRGAFKMLTLIFENLGEQGSSVLVKNDLPGRVDMEFSRHLKPT